MNSGQQLGARDAMLGRIRRALQIPAPKPGSHDHKPHENGAVKGQLLPVINGPGFRQWLPPVGESWDEQAELFARNAEGLKADFRLLDNEESLPQALASLRDEEGWQRVAAHGEWQNVAANLGLPLISTDDGYDADELEKCDAGITGCDALIAQTGSVLITSVTGGGRALSVLPPHHVVLARRAQLVPDLPAAFELLRDNYGDDLPSLMSFVTGPSRTGDIERILVLGAHGPKKLTIFCF
jgi:L-lactate dehydrogenase complex protein LldG